MSVWGRYILHTGKVGCGGGGVTERVSAGNGIKNICPIASVCYLFVSNGYKYDARQEKTKH